MHGGQNPSPRTRHPVTVTRARSHVIGFAVLGAGKCAVRRKAGALADPFHARARHREPPVKPAQQGNLSLEGHSLVTREPQNPAIRGLENDVLPALIVHSYATQVYVAEFSLDGCHERLEVVGRYHRCQHRAIVTDPLSQGSGLGPGSAHGLSVRVDEASLQENRNRCAAVDLGCYVDVLGISGREEFTAARTLSEKGGEIISGIAIGRGSGTRFRGHVGDPAIHHGREQPACTPQILHRRPKGAVRPALAGGDNTQLATRVELKFDGDPICDRNSVSQ